MYNTNWFMPPMEEHGFYGAMPMEINNFQITDDDLEKIKSLIPHKIESVYYSNMVCWSLIDNPQIKNKEELSRLFAAMQFLSMLGSPTPDLCKKYNLQSPIERRYLMFLLRDLYLDFDDHDGLPPPFRHEDTNPTIMMGGKRPFGNSNVLGDVKNAFNKCEKLEEQFVPVTEAELFGVSSQPRRKKSTDHENYEKEEMILLEFSNFLIDFYKGGFDIKWRDFVYHNLLLIRRGADGTEKIIATNGFMDPGIEKKISWNEVGFNYKLHPYLLNWTLDPSSLREDKIKKILS